MQTSQLPLSTQVASPLAEFALPQSKTAVHEHNPSSRLARSREPTQPPPLPLLPAPCSLLPRVQKTLLTHVHISATIHMIITCPLFQVSPMNQPEPFHIVPDLPPAPTSATVVPLSQIQPAPSSGSGPDASHSENSPSSSVNPPSARASSHSTSPPVSPTAGPGPILPMPATSLPGSSSSPPKTPSTIPFGLASMPHTPTSPESPPSPPSLEISSPPCLCLSAPPASCPASPTSMRPLTIPRNTSAK